MKTQRLIKNILPKLTILFVCLAGLKATAQNTIPDFTVLNECEVSNSKGYHDGSGWVDIDNDGDMDLIITNSAGDNKPNLLYRNERTDLFRQITNTEYTLQKATMALSGPYGDLDNDGDQDLILSDWQGTQHVIFKNDGYGNFSSAGTLAKSAGALSALIDMNGDSYLDFVDININGGKIYLNDGSGVFTDFNEIEINPPHPSSSMACITFGDANNDNLLDLYLGVNWSTDNNPEEINQFFLNNGAGRFENEPDTSVHNTVPAPTLGANWVDFDNDGDMDLYVEETSIYGPETELTGKLYVNKGGLVFETQVIEPSEYNNTHKISPVWGDLDNDGDLDLLVAVEKTTFYGHTSSLKHNILFQNNGDGSFTEVLENDLVDLSTHTVNVEDYDNDGDLDVIMAGLSWTPTGTNFLCENQGNDNSWLILTCEGIQSGKTPYGAHIQTIATIDGKRVLQTREIAPTTGHNTVYTSSRVHFGLGDTESADSLIIRWPSGHEDIFTNVKARQFYRAIEDSVLEIDFKATNYIRQNPNLTDTAIYEGESLTYNLENYYNLITGDTVPESAEETLSFSLYINDNADAVNATLEGNILTLTPGTTAGISTVQVLVSAGITERVDGFRVEYKRPSAVRQELSPQFRIYPNPVADRLIVEFERSMNLKTTIQLMDITGKVVHTKMQDLDVAKHIINLADLAKGIYFLKVCTGENTVVKKVIKN